MLMDSRQHGALSRTPARISRKVGGAFSAWGGHLTGYNLALRPGRKIVQAWRATGWWPDHYSIAVFDLQKLGKSTRLRFTQIGIPPHRYSGHYRGWIETYWTPMKEMLEKGALSRQTQPRLTADRKRIRTGRFRRKLSRKN
jgi:activator of HSP90 ATPase